MTQELSAITVSANQIQTLLKRLMRQQPGNMLLATAFNIAEFIDEVSEDFLLSILEGAK